MSTTFKRVAHFRHSEGKPSIEVYGAQNEDTSRFVAVPDMYVSSSARARSVPRRGWRSSELYGCLLNTTLQPEGYYVVTNGGKLVSRTALAMLVNAAFHGQPERSVVIAPPDGELAAYGEIGFDLSGETAPDARVLMSNRLRDVGGEVLARAGYERLSSLPAKDAPNSSSVWHQAEAAES